MPTINQLSSVDVPSGSDLLPIFSQQNGDSRKLSLSNLKSWLDGDVKNIVTQYSVPVSGEIVQVNDDGNSVWLIITPISTLAALSIQLPVASSTSDQQEVVVNCTQTITALSVFSTGVSVVGAPTSLAASAFFRLRFDAVSKVWYRIG